MQADRSASVRCGNAWWERLEHLAQNDAVSRGLGCGDDPPTVLVFRHTRRISASRLAVGVLLRRFRP